MREPLKVLDLFSGIGGFSLGLERAGMTTVAFCEYEEFPRKVLAKHWPDVPCYPDVRELTKEQLDADGIGTIDLICGGFPCQDLSVAGKQAGINAERSGLWSEFARLIGELRPRFALVENVPALLSGDNGRWFGKVLGDLAEIGYDAEWHCIPASYVGACHLRDRAWVVAYPGEERAKRLITETLYRLPTFQGRENVGRAKGWKHMPDIPSSRLCGVGDDVPGRVDRTAALGNAVVPQVVEVIGRAIMEAA